MATKVVKDLFVIETGLFITPPRVNRVTMRIELDLSHRLAKRAIGNTSERPQLNEHARAQNIRQVHGKRNVPDPRARGDSFRCGETDRMFQRVKSNHVTRVGGYSSTFDKSLAVAGELVDSQVLDREKTAQLDCRHLGYSCSRILRVIVEGFEAFALESTR